MVFQISIAINPVQTVSVQAKLKSFVKRICTKKKYAVSYSVDTICTVTEYVCDHASTDTSRDGKVDAKLSEDLPEGTRFLWTNGTITPTSVLRNCSVGIYTVTPISIHNATIPILYACAPAIISVQGEQFDVPLWDT